MIDSDGSSIFGKTTIMNEMNLKGLYDGNFYHVCTDGLEQVTLLKDEEDFHSATFHLTLTVGIFCARHER